MIKSCRPALILLLIFTLLLGVVYPLVVTGIGQGFFPWQANGSLVKENKRIVGSALIGQAFLGNGYFSARPSANQYNAMKSGGSDLGPTNGQLISVIAERVKLWRNLTGHTRPVPIDLVTTSASGLDPDISVAAALYQASRVAKARALPVSTIVKLIRAQRKASPWETVGEPTVNVLALNVALDRTSSRHRHPSAGWDLSSRSASA